MPHRQFNDDASARLAQFEARSLLLRQGTIWRAGLAQKVVAESRMLIDIADAVLAREATRSGWLWPAY